MEKQNPRILFTPMESELLLELIRAKIDIIECKETNKITAQQKNEAYEEIARQFNSNIGVRHRTSRQLRQKYLNLKKDANRLAAVHRAEIRKTGGGIPIVENISSIEESILSMGVVTKPLSTRFDSDASFLDYNTDTAMPDVAECSVYEENAFNMSLHLPHTWAGGRHNFLSTKREISFVNSFSGEYSEAGLPESQADLGSQAGPQRSPSVTPRSLGVPPTRHAGLPETQAGPSGSQTEVASQPHSTREHGMQGVPGSSKSTPKVTAREALNMFRRGPGKKKPTETASSKAAKAILEERTQQMELKRKKDERDSLEHELRVKLLKKQIEVQEMILEALNKNPQDLNLKL